MERVFTTKQANEILKEAQSLCSNDSNLSLGRAIARVIPGEIWVEMEETNLPSMAIDLLFSKAGSCSIILSQEQALQMLDKGSELRQECLDLRLGQAIYVASNLTEPWPELFYEEDPNKAIDELFSKVCYG